MPKLLDGVPPPTVVDQSCAVAHIDNGVHAGCNRERVRSDKKLWSLIVTSTGLNTHDETNDACITTALVFAIDGDRLEVRPKLERVDHEFRALVRLIQGIAVTGQDMEIRGACHVV